MQDISKARVSADRTPPLALPRLLLSPPLAPPAPPRAPPLASFGSRVTRRHVRAASALEGRRPAHPARALSWVTVLLPPAQGVVLRGRGCGSVLI